jgi:glycosyltransferase involved in cell wall biosynthesis
MKVLHVIPSLSPALGGPTQVALKIVRAIRHQGIDAEIVTTNHDHESNLDLILNQLIEYEGVPVWFLPVDYALKEYIFSSALAIWLWQRISDYDLLDNHYLFSYVPTCAAAIARHQKIPYTVRTQGQLTPWALRQSSVKKQLYTSLIERRNLNQAAAIHCTTLQEEEDLRNFGIKTPAITLPLGVQPADPIANAKSELRQLYQIPGDRLIVLFLSRLHPKKRPDLLIEAFQQVASQNSSAHLLMAGSGEADYLAYLQQLATQKQLGDFPSGTLRDRITFTGLITGHQKNILLQGADIFALPSYSENFGIAVAEAMAAGLPVIVTPGVQIAPEIFAAQGGIIVNDRAELIVALTQLLESPKMRSHLSHNAMKLAQDRYNWDSIASQLIAAYGAIGKK